MTEKRNYRQSRRALSQEETRRRIIEATVALHEEIGPRATTISAIAERAGVQRLTVYRHFPDETAVFQACTAHWLEMNPLPDGSSWPQDGPGRLRAALDDFHRYYARTRRMWDAAHRDGQAVAALHEPMAQVAARLRGLGEDLTARLEPPAARRAATAATVRHLLAFPTWQSLAGLGLSRQAAVELAMSWVAAALGRPGAMDMMGPAG